MRQITLTPTRGINGGPSEANLPLCVYDTSGPYTDPSVKIDVKEGLPRLRENWIRNRGQEARYEEVEPSYRPIAGHSDPGLPLPPHRKALWGNGLITQLQLARAGVITPEMEFIAIRENLYAAQIDRSRPRRALLWRRHPA